VTDCGACDGWRLCAPQNRATNAGGFRTPSRRRCRLRPPHSHHIAPTSSLPWPRSPALTSRPGTTRRISSSRIRDEGPVDEGGGPRSGPRHRNISDCPARLPLSV
jgi:hypothetical protein